MSPTRDEILRLLIVMGIRSIDQITDVDIQSILKYNTPFELTDDLQIPYVGYVKSLISDGTGAVKQFAFTEADLTNVADGMGDLILPFTGGQISLALISRSGIMDDTPSGALVNNLAGGPVTSYNSISAAPQYGIVYYVGDSVDSTQNDIANIDNFSNQDISYSKNNGPDIIISPFNNTSEQMDVGDSISATINETQLLVYTIYNADSSVYFTNTTNGPATINGLPFEAGKRQAFSAGNL